MFFSDLQNVSLNVFQTLHTIYVTPWRTIAMKIDK